MSSKFPAESTDEKKIVKIGQYLAKIWTKYDSLVFFGPPCRYFSLWRPLPLLMPSTFPANIPDVKVDKITSLSVRSLHCCLANNKKSYAMHATAS